LRGWWSGSVPVRGSGLSLLRESSPCNHEANSGRATSKLLGWFLETFPSISSRQEARSSEGEAKERRALGVLEKSTIRNRRMQVKKNGGGF
jgi:hypothetical protein